jgi:hypothetical protein
MDKLGEISRGGSAENDQDTSETDRLISVCSWKSRLSALTGEDRADGADPADRRGPFVKTRELTNLKRPPGGSHPVNWLAHTSDSGTLRRSLPGCGV